MQADQRTAPGPQIRTGTEPGLMPVWNMEVGIPVEVEVQEGGKGRTTPEILFSPRRGFSPQ